MKSEQEKDLEHTLRIDWEKDKKEQIINDLAHELDVEEFEQGDCQNCGEPLDGGEGEYCPECSARDEDD